MVELVQWLEHRTVNGVERGPGCIWDSTRAVARTSNSQSSGPGYRLLIGTRAVARTSNSQTNEPGSRLLVGNYSCSC